MVSGTGPADLRGNAIGENGESFVVAAEVKAQSRSEPHGVARSRFAGAVEQVLDGLVRSNAAYSQEAVQWLQLSPEENRGAAILAADAWAITPEEMVEMIQAKGTVGLGQLKWLVVEIQRFIAGKLRAVRVRTLVNLEMKPLAR